MFSPEPHIFIIFLQMESFNNPLVKCLKSINEIIPFVFLNLLKIEFTFSIPLIEKISSFVKYFLLFPCSEAFPIN